MSAARLPLDLAAGAYEAKRALERYIASCGLPRALCELVKLRVSMMNGCAFCVDMHWRALREQSESEARLYGLSAWRETSEYTDAERAALAWAESVTDVAASRVPDAVYEEVSRHFSREDVANLTYVVVAINGWNRLCVAFRTPPRAPV